MVASPRLPVIDPLNQEIFTMSDKTEGTGPSAGPPERSANSAKSRPLRTWPALLLVALMLLMRFGPAYLEGGLSSYWMIAVFGPMICCLLLVIWWLAASRATWKERLFGLLGVVGSFMVTLRLG